MYPTREQLARRVLYRDGGEQSELVRMCVSTSMVSSLFIHMR